MSAKKKDTNIRLNFKIKLQKNIVLNLRDQITNVLFFFYEISVLFFINISSFMNYSMYERHIEMYFLEYLTTNTDPF